MDQEQQENPPTPPQEQAEEVEEVDEQSPKQQTLQKKQKKNKSQNQQQQQPPKQKQEKPLNKKSKRQTNNNNKKQQKQNQKSSIHNQQKYQQQNHQQQQGEDIEQSYDPEESKIDISFFKFLHYYPSPITSLACTKTSSSSATSQQSQQDSYKHETFLALSREDSSIEIWRCSSWSQQLRIQLSPAEKPVHLMWINSSSQNLLCFCSNGQIKLFQPFHSLVAVAQYQCQGGYIWDAKAKNNNNNNSQQQNSQFLLAFEDGMTRIFSVHVFEQEDEQTNNNQNNQKPAQNEEDFDNYYYNINKKQSDIKFISATRNFEERCFGVAWDVSDSGEFFASYESGAIRKFNVQNQVTLQMNVRDQKNKNFAWKIEHTRSGYLVSGCSDGQIFIFETKFGTINKIFKQHESDVLTMLYNPTFEVVYATGSDSKIVCLQFAQKFNYADLETMNGFQSINGEWIAASEDRGQSHDVKALLLLNDTTLVSGGLTTDLCIYNLCTESGLLVSQHKNLVKRTISQMEQEKPQIQQQQQQQQKQQSYQQKKQLQQQSSSFSKNNNKNSNNDEDTKNNQTDNLYIHNNSNNNNTNNSSKRTKSHILGLSQIADFIQVSELKNLVMFKKSNSIELWEFDRGTHNYQMNFCINSKQAIVSATLHNQGQYLAYANQSEILVFKIYENLNLQRTHLIEMQANMLMFARDSKKLIFLTKDGKLCLLKIGQEKPIVLIDKIDPLLLNAQHMCFGSHEHSVIIGSKINNKIVQYSLKESNSNNKEAEDEIKQSDSEADEGQDDDDIEDEEEKEKQQQNKSKKLQKQVLFELPKLFDDASFTTFKYVKQTNQLLVVFENKKIALYDLTEKMVSRWTREYINRVPMNYLKKFGNIIGIVQHPKKKRKFLLYSHYYVVLVNIRQKPPMKAVLEDQFKSEEERQEKINNFTIIDLKNPLYCLKEYFQDKEKGLYAFETDFNEMLKQLPNPVIAKKMII